MKKLLIGACLVLTAVLEAHPVMLTLDGGGQNVPLRIDRAQETRKKFAIYSPGHFKEHGKYAIMMIAKTPDEGWAEAEFYFTAEKDGEAVLTLESGWKKGSQIWVLIQEVKLLELLPGNLENNILKNGAFKEVEANFPTGWTKVKNAYPVTGGKEQGLAVSFGNRATQKIRLRKGVNLKLVIKAKTIF